MRKQRDDHACGAAWRASVRTAVTSCESTCARLRVFFLILLHGAVKPIDCGAHSSHSRGRDLVNEEYVFLSLVTDNVRYARCLPPASLGDAAPCHASAVIKVCTPPMRRNNEHQVAMQRE